MALRNQPYIPLYVQDYLTDEKLNACSPAAQGVYIKIICVLHKSDPYGIILLKQKDKQNASNILNFASKFAKLLPFTYSEIESALAELIEEGVMTLDGDALYQKRMVRDNELSEKRASAGSKGGQARLKEGNLLKQNGKQNSSKQSGKSEANSENEIEYENEIKIIKKDIDTFFESIWKLYPEKKGKGQISDSKKETLYKIGLDNLTRAIERYQIDLKKDTWRKPQNGSTFFNSGYVDYLDANYEQDKPKSQYQDVGDLPEGW